MKTLANYVEGRWQEGRTGARTLHHAVDGSPIASCSTEGVDFGRALAHARKAGAALRALTFHQRAGLVKQIATALGEKKAELAALAYTYGATPADAGMDVDGGIGTLHVYASLGAKTLPAQPYLVEGDAIPLSKGGNFGGQHLLVPLEGVQVQINAFNFPAWGMLEKLAPALLAGMPSFVKPATPTALLAWRVAEIIVGANILPEGALQIVCGAAGDLFEHLGCQDVVAFTGGAATAAQLRTHRTVARHAVRFNAEADSLNACILGPDVASDSPAFTRFADEVAREMTAKAGQKCTAIRRIFVPAEREADVVAALRERLGKVVTGDPAKAGVTMGPLVGKPQLEEARAGIAQLVRECDVVTGDPQRRQFEGGNTDRGGFLEPILLRSKDPAASKAAHEVEVFGPVSTVVRYADPAHAIELVRRGGGSLVSSLYSEDEAFARALTFGIAPYNGRVLVMNAAAAAESTGHGVAMPQLVHGGPGRAGGGEELGGTRAVFHHMQRVALQGHPARLKALAGNAGP